MDDTEKRVKATQYRDQWRTAVFDGRQPDPPSWMDFLNAVCIEKNDALAKAMAIAGNVKPRPVEWDAVAYFFRDAPDAFVIFKAHLRRLHVKVEHIRPAGFVIDIVAFDTAKCLSAYALLSINKMQGSKGNDLASYCDDRDAMRKRYYEDMLDRLSEEALGHTLSPLGAEVEKVFLKPKEYLSEIKTPKFRFKK